MWVTSGGPPNLPRYHDGEPPVVSRVEYQCPGWAPALSRSVSVPCSFAPEVPRTTAIRRSPITLRSSMLAVEPAELSITWMAKVLSELIAGSNRRHVCVSWPLDTDSLALRSAAFGRGATATLLSPPCDTTQSSPSSAPMRSSSKSICSNLWPAESPGAAGSRSTRPASADPRGLGRSTAPLRIPEFVRFGGTAGWLITCGPRTSTTAMTPITMPQMVADRARSRGRRAVSRLTLASPQWPAVVCISGRYPLLVAIIAPESGLTQRPLTHR